MIDYELPDLPPANDIRHVKRLWIYLTSDGQQGWLENLHFRIAPHTGDDDSIHGKGVGSVGEAVDLINDFARASGPEVHQLVQRTPLDFAIGKKCFIALKLYGNFWEFSRRSAGAVRTKDDFDRRYYRLRLHENSGRSACVSFCAEEPENHVNKVRHGINLYVDFIRTENGEVLRLPVTIDPDIENKGGHGLIDGEPSPEPGSERE